MKNENIDQNLNLKRCVCAQFIKINVQTYTKIERDVLNKWMDVYI